MARRIAGLMLVMVLAAACTRTTASPAPTESPAPTASPSASAQSRSHVYLIVMENHSPDQVMSGQYIASLAAKYGVAENYHAVAHPSVPNYLALTSGSTWGVTDDSYHELPQRDLGTQLTDGKVTWRAFMEGMTSQGCIDSPPPYDPGHNPFAFYGGRCPSNVVPLTGLPDLASNTATFTWITPDRCHDTHDCSVDVGDQWLQLVVPQIMATDAWKSNGVIFITWDEDDGSTSNTVLTLVIRPNAKHVVSNRNYNHYSLLATIEDLLGVGRLGEAAQASAMNDLL